MIQSINEIQRTIITYDFFNRLIGLVGSLFASGPENRGSIPGWVIPKPFFLN